MKELTLKVKRAVVVVNIGVDRISLELDLPTPFPEMKYEASALIEARHGYGEQWCREVLGMEPEVIDITHLRS
jgi:hypothetical protein